MSELCLESDEDEQKQKRLKANDGASSRCVSVETIVHRVCRCQRQCCFTQFQSSSGVETIQRARERFQALSNHEKTRFLQDTFGVVPSFHSEIHAGTAGSELLESGSEGDASLLASGSESDGSLLESGSEGDAHALDSGSGSSGDLLSSLSQDDNECPPEPRSKRNYKQRTTKKLLIGGKPVCERAFEGLLGVGGSTLNKIRKEEPAYEGYPQRPKHPIFGFSIDRPGKWVTVVMFFWVLYHSVCETLPMTFTMPSQDSIDARLEDHDYQLRYVKGFLNNLNTYANDPDSVATGPGTFNGNRRYLQHCSLTDLFWEHRAYCEAHGSEPASHTLFFKVAKKIVQGKHIGFRKSSEHSQCDTCYRLKKLIKASRGDAKTKAYQKYSQHILGQWLDRQIYWSWRASSRAWFQQNVLLGNKLFEGSFTTNLLAIIQDGMDQAKVKTPRVAERYTKILSSLYRPMLHLAGSWIHGMRLNLFISDPDLRKDSETSIECLCLSLQSVFSELRKFPLGCILQQDNTYREGKNQFMVAFMIILVSLNVFRFCVLSYLVVGHSSHLINEIRYFQHDAFKWVSSCHGYPLVCSNP